MDKLEISSKFTVEDIHKIREWHYEQKKMLGKKEYDKKLKETVDDIIKDFTKVKFVTI